MLDKMRPMVKHPIETPTPKIDGICLEYFNFAEIKNTIPDGPDSSFSHIKQYASPIPRMKPTPDSLARIHDLQSCFLTPKPFPDTIKSLIIKLGVFIMTESH
jgi:hypothetical protein